MSDSNGLKRKITMKSDKKSSSKKQKEKATIDNFKSGSFKQINEDLSELKQ